MPTKSEPVPWEQQPGESSLAFSAFAEYRDLGPERSIDAVQQRVGKNTRLLAKWSSRWKWVNRAHAYDIYLDRIVRQEREAAIGKQSRRVMSSQEILEELSAIASAPIQGFVEAKRGKNGKVRLRIRLTDKLRAIDMMGRYYKLWERGERNIDNPEEFLARLLNMDRKRLPTPIDYSVEGEILEVEDVSEEPDER